MILHVNIVLQKSDGEYRWHLSRAIPQSDTEGVIQMWVGTSTDVHDSKLFIDELESKVQQRTRELTVINDELIRTNIGTWPICICSQSRFAGAAS